MTTEKKNSFHFQAIVHPIPNGEPNGVEVLKIFQNGKTVDDPCSDIRDIQTML